VNSCVPQNLRVDGHPRGDTQYLRPSNLPIEYNESMLNDIRHTAVEAWLNTHRPDGANIPTPSMNVEFSRQVRDNVAQAIFMYNLGAPTDASVDYEAARIASIVNVEHIIQTRPRRTQSEPRSHNQEVTERPTSDESTPHSEYPSELICPITHMPFIDPVMAEDNNVYERAAIQRYWSTLNVGDIRSPLTNESMNSESLRPVHAIRKMVDTIAETVNTQQTNAMHGKKEVVRTSKKRR
jgi:hypothetical protein